MNCLNTYYKIHNSVFSQQKSKCLNSFECFLDVFTAKRQTGAHDVSKLRGDDVRRMSKQTRELVPVVIFKHSFANPLKKKNQLKDESAKKIAQNKMK